LRVISSILYLLNSARATLGRSFSISPMRSHSSRQRSALLL
jgi:hypothetical protein